MGPQLILYIGSLVHVPFSPAEIEYEGDYLQAVKLIACEERKIKSLFLK